MKRITVTATLLLAACSAEPEPSNGVLPQGPQTNVAAVDAGAIPADVRALAERTVPGMVVEEAERKERDGRTYWDVEGKRPDGSEVEIDMLDTAGRLSAVEIQRDVAWADVPAAVSAAAKPPFVPGRVIESRQVEDGTTIYELFAPGRTDEPAMEVRWQDGKASVLTTRNPH